MIYTWITSKPLLTKTSLVIPCPPGLVTQDIIGLHYQGKHLPRIQSLVGVWMELLGYVEICQLDLCQFCQENKLYQKCLDSWFLISCFFWHGMESIMSALEWPPITLSLRFQEVDSLYDFLGSQFISWLIWNSVSDSCISSDRLESSIWNLFFRNWNLSTLSLIPGLWGLDPEYVLDFDDATEASSGELE